MDNSAGNYAQKHWEGKFSDRDHDDIHNTINVPSEGKVELFLHWEDRNQDYELCMYEASNNGVFFCSTNMQDGIQEPAEELIEENV
jgi:hypothetical protein